MGERLTLKQMVLNEIDNQARGYAEILAPIAGYASGSNLKKVLRDEKKEFNDFGKLINLVKFIFPNDDVRIMSDYSKSVNPRHQTARYMLEYLSSHRVLDLMKELIEKMLNCNNDTSEEWAEVYSLQYEWHTNYDNLDVNSFFRKIDDTKTSIKELKVYLNMLKFYGFYHKQNYRMAYEFSKYIGGEIDDIEDDYIKSVYKARFNESLSYIYLRVLNNPEESRKMSEDVIEANIGLGAVSYAHYNIGCSYIFTSYEKSMKYLMESICLYESAQRYTVVETIKEKVDLLNVLWDKDEKLYTIGAKLLLEAKKGSLQINILEKFKDQIDLPYYLLIKGIKLNNNDLLLESLIEFVRIGDTFMSNIPKIELLNRNHNKSILDAIISLNQAA